MPSIVRFDVIDSGDESVFRKEIYPEYKATRKVRPDDFMPQEQRILKIVKAAGIPIFEEGLRGLGWRMYCEAKAEKPSRVSISPGGVSLVAESAADGYVT